MTQQENTRATTVHGSRDWSIGRPAEPSPAMFGSLEDAVAAPSIHNSQPWRFRIVGPNVVEVLADHTRHLPVVDSAGREMMISIGAALMNLRISMLSRGRQPLLVCFPDRHDHDLVARVTAGPAIRADATVRALVRAIALRHTNRRPLRAIEIPTEVLADLAGSATVEGGRLTVMDANGRNAVLSLIRSANYWQRENPRYVQELSRWTGKRGEPDGISPNAYGPWDAMELLPLRDFGQAYPQQPRRQATFESTPTMAVLYSAGEGPRQWVQAGQALERVLLTATVHGLATTPLSSVVEVPQLRSLLTDDESTRTPQMVIRLGYGDPAALSPRRSVASVLDIPAVDAVQKEK